MREDPAAVAQRPSAVANDQAAGLRRLFDVGPRLLPVVGARDDETTVALAHLAQALARAGERTLVLDCARAQIAAALGLRARFDLAHLARGECTPAQAVLDGGAGLAVVAAARAAACARGDRGALLAPLAGRLAVFDLVVLALQATQCALAGGGEALLVLSPRRERWAQQFAALRDSGDIAAFRLLFPAMDESAAASLCRELAAASARRFGIALRYGGAVRCARDWSRVAQAAAGWELARLPRRLARTI
jgi:flagellar biosynthesis protein FlhG